MKRQEIMAEAMRIRRKIKEAFDVAEKNGMQGILELHYDSLTMGNEDFDAILDEVKLPRSPRSNFTFWPSPRFGVKVLLD